MMQTQLPTSGRKIKFTPERLQQIRNLVERGKSREEIAELIGVTVGSLQDTCSRLGIGLTYTGSRGGDVPLPPINGQSQQNSQSGPVEQPQAPTPHEERARTDEVGLANLALRMKYRGERTRMIPHGSQEPRRHTHRTTLEGIPSASRDDSARACRRRPRNAGANQPL